ncbi:MAG: MoaD/ThiS family protein, partial [Firmicutes bacterium]|nr:MoaD/ThiS family protein [Bacillota bacterium]
LRYVTLFVDDQDARLLSGLDTPLAQGAEVAIVPAMAGGC